jgi:protein O-mannosyl-transferase
MIATIDYAYNKNGKNQNYNKPGQIVAKTGHSKRTVSYDTWYAYWLKYILVGFIFVITFWCYHNSLDNQFTNWDDNRFINENIFIKSFSSANLKMMLFHDVTGDYYNPITIISYAINYHFSGMSPTFYYLSNIIIHILNSILVFFLVLMMLKAMEKCGYGIFKWKEWMAFLCTLAYAIHPMHVESVSWIAERKDVLYAFFYFIGMMVYVHYTEIKVKKYLWLFGVFICYLFSLLSKPMAVVFPFSLLTIDVLLKRDKTISIKNIIPEKLPFFLILIISIISTYHSEKISGAIQVDKMFNFFQRFLFATYSFYIYIMKAFIPIPQSAYYPYPKLSGPSGSLPLIFYISPFIALIVVAIPIYLSYRYGENNFRIAIFGIGFYFFNMVMVSKIISSGPYFLADRYTYVCYFGIFFPVIYFIYKLLEKGGSIRKITITIVSVYMLFLTVTCYERTSIWHNSETLWTDVIEKYPHRVVEAYNSIGLYYFIHHEFEQAYDNYQEAIKLGTENAHVYCNMAVLMYDKKQYDSALDYYTESLNIDSSNADIYTDRGYIYFMKGRTNFAINDYKHALNIEPNSNTEFLLQGIAKMYSVAQQYDSAITYYNRVIQINPNNADYFNCRGKAEYYNGTLKPALMDFLQNLTLAPNDAECMYYLSKIYNSLNDFNNAYKYAQMAQNAGYPLPYNFIKSLKSTHDLK